MSSVIKILLCGDVMLGRGIDQILPFPNNPRIHEPFVKDARHYIRFAEEISGKINYPVSFDYVWGDALTEFEKENINLRIINLETSITSNEEFEPKGINYKLNPKNIEVLKTFKVDIVCLANNHILDYKEKGLLDTLETLEKVNILYCGAGKDINEAKKPAIKDFLDYRVLVFNYAHISSGTPINWKAENNKPGINLIIDFKKEFKSIENNIKSFKSDKDFVIFSIHTGPNWGYEINFEEQEFFHKLIDKELVDLIFAHSSHHFKGLEIYKNKLIFYGAGDFINDYEGIGGYEWFRPNLVLGYIVEVNLDRHSINNLIIKPFKIRKLSLNYCNEKEINWIFEKLKEISIGNLNLQKIDNYLKLSFYSNF